MNIGVYTYDEAVVIAAPVGGRSKKIRIVIATVGKEVRIKDISPEETQFMTPVTVSPKWNKRTEGRAFFKREQGTQPYPISKVVKSFRSKGRKYGITKGAKDFLRTVSNGESHDYT